MNTIKLSDLIGKRVKKIYSGSEIIFLYELSKYVKELLGAELDLEDVQLVKELKSSPYYSYVYAKGLNINYKPLESELVDTSEIKSIKKSNNMQEIKV